MIISFDDAVKKYGPIENGVWDDETLHMISYKPPPIQWINSATGRLVQSIYMNKDMVAPFDKAIRNLLIAGIDSSLKTFDGCFCIRDVRGLPGHPSCHSYGLAIDINAKWNPLGGPVVMCAEFVQCFKDAGFSWGGDFLRMDGMHFSYGWEA